MRNVVSKSLLAALCAVSLAGSAGAVTAVPSGDPNPLPLGGDLTDPENDGNEAAITNPPGQGANFNWIAIQSSSESFFTPAGGNEGAFDVFDNRIGSGTDKWCCDPAPQFVAVTFAQQTILTRFTIASGNDAPERDPDVWFIEGSNDGTTWTPIFTYNVPGTSPFSARLQLLQFDGNGDDFATPAPYSRYRYRVTSTVEDGGLHQINELELFGTPVSNVPALDPRALALLALAIAGIGLAGALRRA